VDVWRVVHSILHQDYVNIVGQMQPHAGCAVAAGGGRHGPIVQQDIAL
jgi:hypothetical protein